MKKVFGLVATVVAAALGTGALAVSFTAGNLVIYRVGGDALGSTGAGLTNRGNIVWLDEYTTNGLTFVQSVMLPTNYFGANSPLTGVGSTFGSGLITRSTDGRFILVCGYGARTNQFNSSLQSTSGTDAPRVIGLVDGNGHIDTTTTLTNQFVDGEDVRAATSVDGTNLWFSGSSSGARYTQRGSGVATNLPSIGNIRQLNIFNNQLYFDTFNSSTNLYIITNNVPGTLPTTTNNVLYSSLSGITNNSPSLASPWAFAFFKLHAGGTNSLDTLYICDAGTSTGAGGGVQKFSLVGATWSNDGSIQANGAVGLTARIRITGINTNVDLWIIQNTSTGAGNDNLLFATDSTGYHGVAVGDANGNILATSAAGVSWRGIAFAPVGGEPFPSGPQNLSVGPLLDFYSSASTGCSVLETDTYSVANFGTGTMTWSATCSNNWISFLPPSGSLGAGGSVTVSAFFNGNATTLPTGTNTTTITFTNTTVGSTLGTQTRRVQLIMTDQNVSPLSAYTPFGRVGGPFSPTNQVYTVSNGSTPITLVATNAPAATWLNIDSPIVSLGACSSTNITVSVIPSVATNLAAGNFTTAITFSNATAGTLIDTRNVTLSVGGLFFCDDFSTFVQNTALEGQQGWAASGGNPSLQVSNNAVYNPASLTAIDEPYKNIPLTSNGYVYAAMKIMVTSAPPVSTTNPSRGPTFFTLQNESGFAREFLSARDTGTNQFVFAIRINGVGVNPYVFGTTPLNYNTPYNVIVRAQPAQTNQVLWVNPGASEDTNTAYLVQQNVGAVDLGVGCISLQSQFSNPGTISSPGYAVFKLCVTTNYADAYNDMTPQTNSWTDGNGKWETGGNWSAGSAPAATDLADVITNAGNNTVTIDATTTNSPSVMISSNLMVSAPPGSTNTLFLNNAGLATPLDILNGITINSGGALQITSSVLQVDAVSGGSFADDGSVLLNTGKIVVTNATTTVGSLGFGQMTVSNGTMLAKDVTVGDLPGSQGTLTIAGGTNSLSGELIVGRLANAAGTVWVTGGQLVVTNNDGTVVGNSGVGQLTVSNGTALLRDVYVGFASGSSGTLTMAGGTTQLSSILSVGRVNGATGAVWVTGGQLVVANADLVVGHEGVGQMTVSNGTVTVNQLVVTNGPNSVVSIVGGTVISGGAFVTNGQVFVVGNGSTLATYHLNGGLHSFANNLRIRASAFLTGCGTIAGGVLVDSGGSALADCGTTFNFSGVVTNNGTIIATGGTVLNFYNPVVNNGLIDASGGNVQFFSTLSDNGTILTPTNSWTAGAGKWETGGNWSAGMAPTNTQAATLITNAASKTVTIDATTSGSFPSTMTIRNLNIAGFGAATNTLALSSAGLITPLHVRSQMTLSNNSAVVVNSSALQVDGVLSLGSPVGSANQLIVTNGGQLVSATAAIGGLPGFNNRVLVTGTNSLWANTNATLAVANSSGGTAIQVAAGASLAASNVFLGNSATADGNIVLVTDAGSTWTNTGILHVGGATHDTQFIVSNGATAFSASAIIGDPLGATNSALVTGSNSFWRTEGMIQVGNGGLGDSLTILDDGAVIASNASHTAQVVVNGATLFLGTGTFATDHLIITNGGAVRYTQTYQVENASVTIDNGNVEASSNFVVAGSANSTSTVAVVGGTFVATFVATNGVIAMGNDGTVTSGGGVGSMTLSNNATVLASIVLLGSTVGGHGTLTIQSGGVLSFPGSNALVSVNALTVEGGADPVGVLDMFNGTIVVGVVANGAMTLDGGIVNCDNVTIGETALGTCRMKAGNLTMSSKLFVGDGAGSTGMIWMDGGTWQSASLSTIGNNGVGQLALSNGVVTLPRVVVSGLGTSQNPGTVTVAGGSLFSTNLIVGFAANSTGTVWITGGELDVTNASAVARLVSGLAGVGGGGRGTVVVSNGTLLVDQLLVTNATKSLFSFVGGTLKIGHTLVSNGAEFAVGDGTSPATLDLLGGFHTFANGLRIANNATLTGSGTVSNSVANFGTIYPDGGPLIFTGTVTNNGLIVTNSSIQFLGGLVNNGTVLDAAGDADGDGMNNLSEMLAGTNPNNNASVFHVTAVTKVGNDLQVNWSTVGGKRYVVQTSPGTGGDYTNNFTDLINSAVSMPGTGESTTSYLDSGAATGNPARYYRVRLVP